MKAVLGPHGADFLGRCDIAALDLAFCFKQIGFFLLGQLNRQLMRHGQTISQQKGPGKTGAFKLKNCTNQRE
jgi:hypothetical protein